jgi:hypothetical protein
MITLTTSVYEKDFRFVLNKENWFYNYKNDLITKKIVIINNINNIDEFLLLKKEFENDFEFYYSSDYIDKIHKTFNVLLSPQDISHYYSIHHYTSLLVNENEYGFHVSADCSIVGENLSDFFENSIELFNVDESVKSTTIFWVAPEFMESVGKNEEDYHNIQKRHEKFYFSHVFSDPVYFYKKSTLSKCDLTYTTQLHPCLPYAVNSFEYRLTNYYISQNIYRAVYKSNLYFIHKSF